MLDLPAGVEPGIRTIELQLLSSDGELLASTEIIATGDFSRELAEFAHRFPSLQRELIDRRDHYMARRLVALLRDGQRVVAVVGEGHLAGLTRRLDCVSPQVVPLSRLLELGRQA